MRLFGLVDGTIDRRDRAGWVSCPFDLQWDQPPINQGRFEFTIPRYQRLNNEPTISGLFDFTLPREPDEFTEISP